ncbi:hypothetical protein NQ315_014689, partial [Exocentrus adspersus]
MVGIYCAVAGCWELYGGKSSKHRFPNPKKFPELFQKWIEICENPEFNYKTHEEIYNTCRVCSKHFTANDFQENNILKRTAVPHVNVAASQGTSSGKENRPVPSHTEQGQDIGISSIETETSSEGKENIPVLSEDFQDITLTSV